MSQQLNNCQENSGGPVVSPVAIGRKIRASRKQRGMTQWELARAIGCSQTTIGDIEAGYFPAASRFMPAAVAALGLSTEG